MRTVNVLDFENKRRYFRSQLESQFSTFRSRYRFGIRSSKLVSDDVGERCRARRSPGVSNFRSEEGACSRIRTIRFGLRT